MDRVRITPTTGGRSGRAQGGRTGQSGRVWVFPGKMAPVHGRHKILDVRGKAIDIGIIREGRVDVARRRGG